jgi:hypothetical protein
MIPLSSMTFEERERLCYTEGFTQAADLLGKLDDLERERDTLTEQTKNLIPVRYFVIDYDLEDGPELIECDEREFLQAEGEITYERHTVRENGVNQICLSKA